MTQDLQASIESYLIEAKDWVSVPALVEHFRLEDERYLRADGRFPGPLSRCTIFSSKGVKHISCATKLEIIRCRNRIKRELISRVRRFRWLQQAIAACLDSTTKYEKHTNQGLLFP